MKTKKMAWVIFDPSTTDLDTFLREKAPSRLYREDGVAWISVRRSTSNLQHEEETGHDEDLIKEGLEFGKEEELEEEEFEEEEFEEEGFEEKGFEEEEEEFEEEDSWNSPDLKTAWEELFARYTSRPTHEAICSFAKEQRCMVGKWLLHAATGSQIDGLWSDIARAVVEGKLGSAAKVSPRREEGAYMYHVICVYNDDFTDIEAVRGVEKGIRSLGFFRDMMYKPDLFTYLKIDDKNHYRVKPNIYSSKLDRSTEQLVFKFTQPSTEANPQSKMTQFMKKISKPPPHKHKAPPTERPFLSFLRVPRNSGKRIRRSKPLKSDSLMEDKSQAKLTSFFKGVPSSSPSKRKHLSESQNLEGEPTEKRSTRMDDIHGSSETALDPDAPPLPALNPP
ncbi:uncharacterized protein LOC119743222 isoform X2 [Patiria miniata]|uniref:Uncharacterized protein n=1 Tax=Patiria miniata TaxID=46514 RepID=A0A914BGZ4_PATMI|nr:uncharacterized protein LOC119743222 isoform X2 [Patiria miniata]